MSVKSKKPTKQRNAQRRAEYHQVHKLFTIPLDKSLQEEWGVKRLPLRKDDVVKVVKGEFNGIQGKVLSIQKTTMTVTIEECTFEKKNGQTGYQKIHVSKLLLMKFADKKGKIDSWRLKVIQRKSKLELEGQSLEKEKKEKTN